ncbi:barstar family protein [Streptomyces doebereineriae]|uniref:Barstar family protein n=1 Tax=Streptomyces doebereineriae TaxID=3075528 RepID=A0ABU2VIW4_9ACTN|nr:barstar family protein [Streptomyces sp. DSM 41640]MDT0485492.1 barstar family protein [Streptomyces sp. DSM 41640]
MGAPKYVLLSYDREAEFEGEEGYEETWALCEDAEDLFADPPPPLRGVYELLGCAPQGRLCEALTRARAEGSAPLGTLTLEILDKTGAAVGEWHLEEARLLGDRPCARDVTLRDVTIEGTEPDHNPYDYPRRPPLSPGYRLLGSHGEPHGTCRDLARVREIPDETMEPPLRLLGCSPQGALRTALDAGEEDLGHAKVLRIDISGRPLQSAAEGELRAWIPSARGPGLVDLTLDLWSERPPFAAGEVWELWTEGRPTEPNRWARCDDEGRQFWLRTALDNHVYGGQDRPPGTMYHLDGRHITDLPGFFCALGEAVNGPGGYFGWGLDALDDCLMGRWGATPPLSLVWHDSEVARRSLGVTPQAPHGPSAFEELLAFLAEGDRVDVHLA